MFCGERVTSEQLNHIFGLVDGIEVWGLPVEILLVGGLVVRRLDSHPQVGGLEVDQILWLAVLRVLSSLLQKLESASFSSQIVFYGDDQSR